MSPIRLAIVGLGKIARDQHLAAIEATPGIDLVAVASRNASLDGVACFSDVHELLAADVQVDAVSFCTPPQGRFEQAKAALDAGKHVMLEKPPGASVAEVYALEAQAKEAGLTLFATWHSRQAAAVEPARDLIAGRKIKSAHIEWKEDVRHWHPGQQWIWEPGGLGVFDPGINALSIATRIMPQAFHLKNADLSFPANRAAPIAADLAFEMSDGTPLTAAFDWRQTGPQSWNITVETDQGTILLTQGGSRLSVDGTDRVVEGDREYASLYQRFVSLVGKGERDVDLSPLIHVADSFLLGRRHVVDAFDD